MENRYLFKAKRIDNREWEIGSLIALPTGEYEISNKCNNPPDCDPMWDKVVITHKVDPSTICRCTGLRSKNGKLIWEKDIIRCKLGKVIVLWDEAQWKVKKCDEVFIWYKDLYFWVSDRNAEVIGNIFDNKELLESEG